MDILAFVLWFAVGFAFGSVPSGLWLVKAIHGIDIREYGSKNIGSTNVFRTVGGKTAALVLLCDAGKGILAAYLAQTFTGGDMYAVLFAAIGALLGHNYSLFLGFKALEFLYYINLEFGANPHGEFKRYVMVGVCAAISARFGLQTYGVGTCDKLFYADFKAVQA